jgi:lipopolysaccharide export system permease protein
VGILERYLLREYLKIFSLALSALVIVYLLVDFFEKIRRFVEYGAGALPVAAFFFFKLPRIIFEMTPLAILISTVLIISSFSRTHEITAMKAGGVSLIRVMLPLLGMGLVLGLILMMANQSFIAKSTLQSKKIRQVQIEKKPQTGYFKQQRVWLRLDSRTFLNVQLIEPSQAVMYGVSFYKLSPDFSLQEMLEAKELRYENGLWLMVSGVRRTFDPDFAIHTEVFERRPMILERNPEDFQNVMLREDEMTYQELEQYQERLSREGFNARRYQVEMSSRLALPFVSFIMILVGIPSGLRGGPRTGLAKGIGLCLVIAMAYWFLLSLSISLGRGGALPPVLSAWLANMTFAAVGGYLFLQIKQ